MIYQRIIFGFGFKIDLFIYPTEGEDNYYFMWTRAELIKDKNCLIDHIHLNSLDLLEQDDRFQFDSRLCYLHHLN